MKIESKSRDGLTILELMIAIAILAIIIVALIPLVTFSYRSNKLSESSLGATYEGIDVMEEIYLISKELPYDKVADKLTQEGYTLINEENGVLEFSKYEDKFIYLKLKDEKDLVRVLLKIYRDKEMQDIESQYETLYTWTGKGVLIEDE